MHVDITTTKKNTLAEANIISKWHNNKKHQQIALETNHSEFQPIS